MGYSPYSLCRGYECKETVTGLAVDPYSIDEGNRLENQWTFRDKGAFLNGGEG